MPEHDVETFHENDQWKNKIEGSSRAASTHATKAEAVASGREMAQNRGAEHIIKNLDGTIAQRNSYGNDPRDIKG